MRVQLTTSNMVAVSFYVRKQASKKNGLYPILMRVSFGGDRITIGQIGLSIADPAHLRQNVIQPECVHFVEYNTLLQREAFQVEQIAQDLASNCSLDLNTLKERYLLSKNRQKPRPIIDVYNEYLEIKEKEYNLKEITCSTYRKWCNSLGVFTTFLRETKESLSLSIYCLNKSLFNKYDYYLTNEIGYHRNTASRFLVYLKAIARYAVEKNYIVTSMIHDCKASTVPSNIQPLNIDEYKKIKTASFSKARHTLVQDMFLFACYTGLAYADMQTLSKKDIKEVGDTKMIIKNRVKTHVEADIPLIDSALEILKKYDRDIDDSTPIFPIYSNQKTNDYLKEIAEILGIEKNLTFHIARHTFATFNLDMGVTLESVSTMLGHNSTKTTRIYAKVTRKKIRSEIKLFQSGLQHIDMMDDMEEERKEKV